MVGSAFSAVPAIVYFHENQLVYPNRHTAEWDLQFPLTNITSALSAEACVFNSRWNLEAFLGAIPGFLARVPRPPSRWGCRENPREVVCDCTTFRPVGVRSSACLSRRGD